MSILYVALELEYKCEISGRSTTLEKFCQLYLQLSWQIQILLKSNWS